MATDCMPTAPAAPGLLVITTGCLSARSSAEASGRPVRSAWPPGGNGLTIVTGRVGKGSCAETGPATSHGRTTTTSRHTSGREERRRVMVTSATQAYQDGGREYHGA